MPQKPRKMLFLNENNWKKKLFTKHKLFWFLGNALQCYSCISSKDEDCVELKKTQPVVSSLTFHIKTKLIKLFGKKFPQKKTCFLINLKQIHLKENVESVNSLNEQSSEINTQLR